MRWCCISVQNKHDVSKSCEVYTPLHWSDSRARAFVSRNLTTMHLDVTDPDQPITIIVNDKLYLMLRGPFMTKNRRCVNSWGTPTPLGKPADIQLMRRYLWTSTHSTNQKTLKMIASCFQGSCVVGSSLSFQSNYKLFKGIMDVELM